jgi:general secretion pathway protein F
MAVFEWHGINAKGRATKGVRDAENAKALHTALRKEGILVTSVEEEDAARIRTKRELNLGRLFQRVSSLEVALVTRQLATLLHSGVPLVEALSAIIEQLEHPILKKAFTQTRDKVNEGMSLAEALSAHPKVFTNIYINMVAAGEASGTLDKVLERLSDFLDGQVELKNKVTGALVYPMIMACVALGVVSMMMIFVVPKVASIYEDFKQTLPWYTSLLITTSNFISHFWWLIVMVVGASYWGIRRWKNSEKGHLRWDQSMLSLPLIGKVVLMVAIARFARTLSTLLASGVPVLAAMDITRAVVGNTVLMGVIAEARTSVQEGESIAAPLKRSGHFPPIVTHMIAIGERSGELEQMLEHVAVAYDNEVSVRVNTMTKVLEPMIILMMAGMVGSMALAILMPLMQINSFIN